MLSNVIMSITTVAISVVLLTSSLLSRTCGVSLIAMSKYFQISATKRHIEKCENYLGTSDIENEIIPFEEVPPCKDSLKSFPEWINEIAIPVMADWVAKNGYASIATVTPNLLILI